MRVLLGVSDDDRSWRALGRTVEWVGATGAELTVAVFDRDGSGSVEAVREEVADHLAEAALDAEVRPLEGDAAVRLVELAESEGFDRLVIGGGGESPMGKVTVDDLEQYVVLNCRTTVTIVR